METVTSGAAEVDLFFTAMAFLMAGKAWFVCIQISVIFWWLEARTGRRSSLPKMRVIQKCRYGLLPVFRRQTYLNQCRLIPSARLINVWSTYPIDLLQTSWVSWRYWHNSSTSASSENSSKSTSRCNVCPRWFTTCLTTTEVVSSGPWEPLCGGARAPTLAQQILIRESLAAISFRRAPPHNRRPDGTMRTAGVSPEGGGYWMETLPCGGSSAGDGGEFSLLRQLDWFLNWATWPVSNILDS